MPHNVTIDTEEAQIVTIQDGGIVQYVYLCKTNISAILCVHDFYSEKDGYTEGEEQSELLRSAKMQLDKGETSAAEETLSEYYTRFEHRYSFTIHPVDYLP